MGRSKGIAALLWLCAALFGGIPVFASGDAAAVLVPSGRTAFVLSVNWHPAFCETRAARPECVGQTADRLDAMQFSLGGLSSVGKRFCGVTPEMRALDRKRDWMALPAVALDPALAAKLATAMPGAVSGLDRHEWLRSGTCQTLGAQDYVSLQLRLLDAVNGSAVRALFRDTMGGEVTDVEVRAAFDRSFGAGAGERVKLQCRKAGARLLVTGLTIGLSGNVAQVPDLGRAILSAAPTSPKCERGIVDRAGTTALPVKTVVDKTGADRL